MTTIYEVPLGGRFSFEVYPTAVLGNNFRDVRLEGFLTPQLAMSFGTDIAALHANVYPSLPAGVPNDPMQYSYMRIQLPSGQYAVLGIPWVRAETIQLTQGRSVYMTFSDKTEADINRMLLALSSIGQKPDDVRYQ